MSLARDGSRAAARPDIVLCTADQLRPYELGCYGGERVSTPALDRLAADEALRCLVVRATGGSFSAGNDLNDFLALEALDADTPVVRVLKALGQGDKPMLAAVDGVAIGIGTTLLLHCDLVFATPTARFGAPFVPLGLVPEAASSRLLVELIGYRRAMAMFLLGEQLDVTAAESLETSMIHSLAGTLPEGGVLQARPFMEPHHTASVAAIAGGGKRAGPGQISLAHNGVLFMDEFPEFPRPVLETLRQPIETGEVVIARANAHVRYPCRFLLVAAANPCRCGMLFDPDQSCSRAPGCGEDYMGRVSGPLMDRFDLRLEVPAVGVADLSLPPSGDTSATIAARVAAARARQTERYADAAGITVNADMSGDALMEVARPDAEGADLLDRAVSRFRLTARGYHRILKVARTIADLEGCESVRRPHLAEALSYRLIDARAI